MLDGRFDLEEEYSPNITWPIHRIRRSEVQKLEDVVLVEEPLEIVINGQRIAVLMRMPGQEKELVAGFCISEGYVTSARDILLIHHCGSGHLAPGEEVDEGEAPESRNRVEVRVSEGRFNPPEGNDMVRLIRSGCGAADVSAISDSLPYLSSDFSVNSSVLLRLGKAMREMQRVHHKVGGTHSAALFYGDGGAVCQAEDIGRHNAVDKVIGYCLLRKVPLEEMMLVTSGRASYEMAMKAVRVGIPVIATISAPTSMAVHLAEDRGLTLIGYLRGGRMNVYTHGHRVKVD
ncbi:MAG: formate dehydrogenase accessory sulfurtransferase FdhD [Deltaproteobacteria bacterium]|nr:formate dehydrogenase accessory sulfurtransferase FdhD [Deltaproteobacteria bacterium]